MKVIFFGAGSHAKYIWEKIKRESDLYSDEYLAFADNNKKLWGKNFCGKKVIAPTDIPSYEVDIIVIASIVYETFMREQLIKELKISKRQVYSWEEYSRLCFCKKAYRKKYNIGKEKQKDSSVYSKRTVVYTAITGNYDILKNPLFVDDNLSYVCITNNRNIKSKVWSIKYIEDASMDNVHLARHIKMNPHLFFPDYEMSIWVDGKFQIMDDLRKYAAQYKGESNMVCFPHPERLCICDELAACILWTNGVNKDMITQVADYLKKGMPLNYGLYDTGCIVRLHNDTAIKSLMYEWGNEVTKYSFRDQLSFPYICWKKGYIPDICDLDIARNQWLLYKGHLSVAR